MAIVLNTARGEWLRRGDENDPSVFRFESISSFDCRVADIAKRAM
jgi:hypothetical protein